MRGLTPLQRCSRCILQPHADWATLTGTTAPDQSGSGSNGNEGILHIPQSSRIETSKSDIRLCVGGFYPSAEMELAYFTASANWAARYQVRLNCLISEKMVKEKESKMAFLGTIG